MFPPIFFSDFGRRVIHARTHVRAVTNRAYQMDKIELPPLGMSPQADGYFNLPDRINPLISLYLPIIWLKPFRRAWLSRLTSSSSLRSASFSCRRFSYFSCSAL